MGSLVLSPWRHTKSEWKHLKFFKLRKKIKTVRWNMCDFFLQMMQHLPSTQPRTFSSYITASMKFSYFGLNISHKKKPKKKNQRPWKKTWTAQPTSLITIWKLSITLCLNDLKPTLSQNWAKQVLGRLELSYPALQREYKATAS